MIVRIVFFFFFSSYTVLSFAQEQLGLRTENYSGINSIFLNPANNLTSPFQWDVNLVALGQFIDNNVGGFRNASVSDLLNSRSRFFLATNFRSDQQFPADAIVFDFEAPGKKKFGSEVLTLTGPAFMLNFEQHSVGLFTNFRAVLSGQSIPAVLGYYDYKSIQVRTDYNVMPSQAGGMAWNEIGLNYLYKTETANGQLGIGINVKYLQGFESFFIKNNFNLDITKLEMDALDFNNGANIDFGFTTSSLDAEDLDLQKSGTGFGLDLGLTFAMADYLDGAGFKMGISLLDMGKIKFTSNTEKHKIDLSNPFFFNPRNLQDVTRFREGLAQLNDELFTDTTTTFVGNNYEIWLPGALSLQADFALQENIYVNVALVQRLPIGKFRVSRGNLLAVTPRYESRWISAFLPISLYNYQHLKVGTAFRLAFLTFGSEDLVSFFGKKQLNSTDFYIALKLNPFNLGWKEKSGKAMKCYSF